MSTKVKDKQVSINSLSSTARIILFLQFLPLFYIFLDILPFYGSYKLILLLSFLVAFLAFFVGSILGLFYFFSHKKWENLFLFLGLPVLTIVLITFLPVEIIKTSLTQKILDAFWCSPNSPKTAENILGEIYKLPDGTFEVDEATCLIVACTEELKTYTCSGK